MKLIAQIRPTETRELAGEGDTYTDAREAIEAQVPDGWVVTSYREG
jgi:hypothetical protein